MAELSDHPLRAALGFDAHLCECNLPVTKEQLVRCVLVNNVGGSEFDSDKTYENYYMPLTPSQLAKMLTGLEEEEIHALLVLCDPKFEKMDLKKGELLDLLMPKIHGECFFWFRRMKAYEMYEYDKYNNYNLPLTGDQLERMLMVLEVKELCALLDTEESE